MKKTVLCLIVILAGCFGHEASALVEYGTDTTLDTAGSPYDRFYMHSGAVLTVPAGETVDIASGDTYPTSYTDATAPGGGGTLDVFGTMNFDTGHGLGVGDGPTSATDEGTINIHPGGEINTAMIYAGARMKGTVNIWGTLNLSRGGTNTGGTLYDGPAFFMWSGLEPEGQSIINQFDGSHVESDNVTDSTISLAASGNGSGAYNMMGGTLIVGDIIGGAANAVFNYSKGTVVIEGQDRTDILTETWFNDLGTNTVAAFSGGNTTITSDGGTRKIGDANNDTFVNELDLRILLDNYFVTEPRPGFDEANWNFDDTVDENDYLIWETEFLAGGGSLAELNLSIPEPSSLALLISVTALCCGRRQRRQLRAT